MGLDFSGNRRRTNDSASFANFLDSKPKQTNDSASFANFIGNQKSGGDNSGIQAFKQTQQGGSGSNIAQQVLGDAYSQAIGLGYKPSELIDMIANAQSYGQGINVDKFKTDLDRYEGFLDADVPGGNVFKFDDPQDDGTTITKQYLNVTRPEVTANPPEGVMGLLGAMFSPFADLAGAGAKFLLEGGTAGKILGGLKDQFSKGKGFLGDVFNPGDIAQRLDAAGPEAKRKYAMFMQQGDPYQVAFQKATGQAFARGGVANL